MTRPLQSRAARPLNSAQRSARWLALATLAFLSATSLAAAQSALPIFVADFNHDGIPDVLVLSTTAPTGTVALGSVPYGTFSPAADGVTFPAACTKLTGFGGAAPIVIADVNADGFPDIVFRCRTDPSLGADGLAGVMLGNGDGTFAAPVTLPTYISTETVVADFDGDGKLDIVLVGEASSSNQYGLIFYKGNGDGTFAAPASLNFGTSSSFNPNFVIESAAVADVNGDGYLDIVTESIFSPGSDPSGAPRILSVFGNNKDGTFGQVTSGATVPNTTATLGNYPDVNAFSVLPANVYGSGKPDFLIPDIGTTPGILAVKNTSTPTTYSLANPVRIAAPGLTDARPGNFTGNVFSDIAVASATGITVLANDGAGNFTAGYSTLTALLPTAGQFSGGFAVADANNDTYSDIYTASANATGGIDLNVSLVSGSATATAAPVTLGIGNKDVSAAWPGNVNFAASTATGTQTVQGVPTVVILTSSSNPATLGDTVTFNVSVASTPSYAVFPTGTLILQADGVTIGTGTLQGAPLSFQTSQLTQGPHAIIATYMGDNSYAGAVSTTLNQVINHLVAVAPTLTWLTPAPITLGTPLNSAQLDAVATDVNGTTVPGTLTYTPAAGTILPVGPQTLSVTFTPTDLTSFLTATQTVVLNVLPGVSTTALTVSSNASAVTSVPAGTVITLTATVNVSGAALSPGQVNFCDAFAPSCTDIHLLGTAQLTPNGTAIFSFVPGIGTHTYKAVFLGTKSVNQSAAMAASALIVTAAIPTTTTLQQTGAPGNYTLTAITSGAHGVAPSGTVSFLDTSNGSASLGKAVLGSPISQLSFTTASMPTVGRQSVFIVAADLNGDGKMDLLTTDAYDSDLTVLLGNGDGTFTPAPKPSTGGYPDCIAVGDYNGDGKPDIAFTNYYDGTLTIQFGNGDGTFTAGTTYTTGADPRQVMTGDFNGDGNLDLAISRDSSVLILLGNGDGTFTTGSSFSTGSGPNYSLVLADFNGDGILDMVTTDEAANTLTVLLGDGDGNFTASASPATGNLPTSVVVADFNGDGKPDLAVSSLNSATLTILLGNGDGTFVAAPSPAAGNGPGDLAVGDFNHDGVADLAVVNEAGRLVNILTGNGDGTFTSQSSPATGASSYLAVADFDGDGVADLGVLNRADQTISILLSQLVTASTATATGISPIAPGTHQVVASYPGDSSYTASQSAPVSLIGLQNFPTISFTPAIPTIVYGTPLGLQQLNAVATGTDGAPIDGVFTYTPAAGTILPAGTHTLSVTFTPTSTIYVPSTVTAQITITQAIPALTWTAPASIAYGIPLGATQLDAAVTGVTGAALPGTFTYTPAAGTVLTPGTHTLSVQFAPTDGVDYIGASGTVSLQVTGLAPTTVSPGTIPLGSGNTTVTITGAGFVASSIVQVNGAAVPTTLVNPTTLTAIIPAADFTQQGTLQVVVVDPTIGQTSPALSVTVIPASPQVILSGPSTVVPGTQPTLSFALQNPYPVTLNGDFDLSFSPAVNPPVDDPAVQFATGGRSLTFTVPADSTAVPTVQLQSGTVAGTITIPLLLTANGVNVTPTSIQPVVIVIPAAIPAVSSATMTKSGDQLTVVMHGFSNTREVTQATFHFVGITGAQIDTPDVTVPVGPAFTAWYSSAASDQYGSTFTYTQAFTVGGGAANIDSVQVTLTNTVGASVMQTAQ